MESAFKFLFRNAFTLGRVEAQGIEILFALRGAADGVAFSKRTIQILRNKAAQVMNFDPLIILFHKVSGQVSGSAALITDQNHFWSAAQAP